jgi:hypothetical protein
MTKFGGMSSTTEMGGGPSHYVRKAGMATLVNGTVTVTDAGVTANTVIVVTPQETGIFSAAIRVSARSVGTSFTITGLSLTDTASVGYLCLEPV